MFEILFFIYLVKITLTYTVYSESLLSLTLLCKLDSHDIWNIPNTQKSISTTPTQYTCWHIPPIGS